MNKQRLLQIAEDVLAAPAENFNMRSWCGTSCCAIGWHMKMHPEVPFTLFRNDPCFNGMVGFDAVADYCGIPWDDAWELFSVYAVSDPTDKAAMYSLISAYIASHVEAPVIEMKPDAASRAELVSETT